MTATDAPFEIDPESGLLTFAQVPLTLTPKQPLATFLATAVGGRAEGRSGSGGWQGYQLWHDLGDGQTLGVSLFFLNALLVKVRFGYRSEGERARSGWSEKRELTRAEIFRNEIVRQLGRRGRFDWGTADAGYDDKAASAALFVNYV